MSAANQGASRARTIDASILGPAPQEAFYSFVSITPPSAPYFRYDMGQKAFSDKLFPTDMSRHLAGVNSDIGVKK